MFCLGAGYLSALLLLSVLLVYGSLISYFMVLFVGYFFFFFVGFLFFGLWCFVFI